MRREKRSPGGACWAGLGDGAASRAMAGDGSATLATTGRAGAGVAGSAFTKCCSDCVVQPEEVCLVRWQQPCAGWCVFNARRTCGQEKQLPQNSAAITRAAIIELETVRSKFYFRTYLAFIQPPHHAQGSQRVPAAGLAHLLHLEKDLAGIAVLERPAAVGAAVFFEESDGVRKAIVARGIAVLEVVQAAKNVVMPARREREARISGFTTAPVRCERNSRWSSRNSRPRDCARRAGAASRGRKRSNSSRASSAEMVVWKDPWVAPP